MTRNQLPEGVGKKIVEALKRQAEADITPVDAAETSLSNDIPLTEIQDVPEFETEEVKENTGANDNLIVEEELLTNPSEDVYQEKKEEEAAAPNIMDSPLFTAVEEVSTSEYTAPLKQEEAKQSSVIAPNGKINIPQNIQILKSLIGTLPVGVTKQTGAQIIRQTLEAMGLPMNGVLKEAQEVQEELNSSTRECMVKIQEYKTHIMQLEQSVQEYQKNITQINDLVSLFLLTDRK